MSEYKCDIKQLAELLQADREASDSDDDIAGTSKIGPGDIGQRKPHGVSINKSAVGEKSSVAADPDAIWQADEVANQLVGEVCSDPRELPEYEIKYQQSLSPEEVFLQLTGKTTSTASCENMVVTIHMKGETKSAIDLSITSSILDIRSPLYRLHLCLPHPVNAEKGRAEWNDKEETLTVQLAMVREYDFINF